MIDDADEKDSLTCGLQHGRMDQPKSPDVSGDFVALDAALSLGLRVARAPIETCAIPMGDAEAALGSRQEALPVEAILNAVPLLFEAQTILNAATMRRRIVRKAETTKT